MSSRASQRKIFGDFQTPGPLAHRVAEVLASEGISPRSLVEPSCGTGTFLIAGLERFSTVERAVGIEINLDYLAEAKAKTSGFRRDPQVELRCDDVFSVDWSDELRSLPEPILILGNPPWVTSAGVGLLGGKNVPEKSNAQGLSGLDALMGKSNFDIAEWLILRLLDAARGRKLSLAMLIKTHVARRCFLQLWKSMVPIRRCVMYEFDAQEHFGVAAQACLFVCETGGPSRRSECEVRSLDAPGSLLRMIAVRDGAVVADARAYDDLTDLLSDPPNTPGPMWRSGVKHDCADVLELRSEDGAWINGFGERVDVEQDCVFGLLKGSDVARVGHDTRELRLIVPQRRVSDDPESLTLTAPRLWSYLCAHGELLDGRASSIYRGRPRFSVFGVGAYTFAPWKVAVCGLYKAFRFRVVGPVNDRPVVFDDTVYQLAFADERDARLAAELLTMPECQRLLEAMVFWDSKRPITMDILKRVDLRKVARRAGCSEASFLGAGGTNGMLF